MRTGVTLVLAVALTAAACGGSSDGDEPLTVDEYIDYVNGIAIDFDIDIEEAEGFDFPLEGELGRAAIVFTAYDRGLQAMRAVAPPDVVRSDHENLVRQFQEMQDAVANYLQKASLEPSFTMEGLNGDPLIAEETVEFLAACRALAEALYAEKPEAGLPDVCMT